MGLSNDLSCGWESLLLPPQPQRVFSIRGLRLYFPMLEPRVVRFALLPTVPPGLSVRECGAIVCYPGSACPVLRHSESGPLGLSAQMWGRRVCQWSDCLPRSSHTPPVSVPPRQRESSPPLLLVWMNVYFLFPWCRTSLPFDFLSVLVVRGGAVCLPMPPSWFSPQRFFLKVCNIYYWEGFHMVSHILLRDHKGREPL